MIRINDEKIYIQDDGSTKRVITGSCNGSDKQNLPKDDIMNGSYMYVVDGNAVSFFDEDAKEWG
jgi:hypothetical protein